MFSEIISYLKKKGIDKELLSSFKIALFDTDRVVWGDFPEALKDEALKQVRAPSIVVPIFNLYSEPEGFIVRYFTIEPKYYVSTPRKCLFGLNLAFPFIAEKNRVFLVEGPFDFIVLYTKGLRNVVSILGSMLRHDDFYLLARFTDRFVFVLDPDTDLDRVRNSLLKFKGNGVSLYVTKTFELDPDEFVLQYGVEHLLGLTRLPV